MSELFIEIGVEEIPVTEINTAIEYLSNSITQLLRSQRITYHDDIKEFSTPRRLAICITGLSDKAEPSIVTYTGPRKEAAFDKKGNPTQAAIGFARSKGIDVKDLRIVRLEKGEFVQAEIKNPGISTKSLIKDRLSDIILSIPFKKSMRWNSTEKRQNDANGSIRFIRPIRWLVVLYNGKVIPVWIGNVKASSYTYGLRAGGEKKIKITGFNAWVGAMKKEKILPAFEARKDKIREETDTLAKRINGIAVPDIGLLETITNLVESPTAILGSFDKRFMNMPEEVIMSVMKTHQKYIPVMDDQHKLMPYFIGISNNPHGDKKIIRKGYERVLHARLEDAEFYYREDIKQPLEFYIELLKGIVFFPQLGSLYDKTQRIVAISSHLCDQISVDEQTKDLALKAARLYKADLATRLVSEFPELQGIIGYHYLLKTDPNDTLTAMAILEQYRQPDTIHSAIVYIADKIDSLVGFFGINEIPSGTQDPYGLRRAAIGIINTILNKGIRINIKKLIEFSFEQYDFPEMPISYPSSKEKWTKPKKDDVTTLVLDYIYGRLEGILHDRYYTEDTFEAKLLKKANPIDKLIAAVIATEPQDLLDVEQRIYALKNIVFEQWFEPILLAFKRVINISKDHTSGEIRTELFVETPEKNLYSKYLELDPYIKKALENKQYSEYIHLIQQLVEPINTFFDKVLVMSDNDDIRKNRLNLLAKIKNLVMQVIDIIKLL